MLSVKQMKRNEKEFYRLTVKRQKLVNRYEKLPLGYKLATPFSEWLKQMGYGKV